jgi:hypothetical protein
MAEILTRSQSPVTHQVFWNGDVAVPSAPPTVKLYDVTLDPAILPLVNPTHLLTTLTSVADENNLGSYLVNVPYQYTDRNRTLRLRWEYTVDGTQVTKDDEVFVVTSYIDFNHIYRKDNKRADELSNIALDYINDFETKVLIDCDNNNNENEKTCV